MARAATHALTWALARVMRRLPGRKKLPRPPEPLTMVPIEREYRTKLLRILEDARALLYREFMPNLARLAREARADSGDVRMDAWMNEVRRLFDSMRELMTVPRAEDIATDTARDINGRNAQSIRAQMRAVLEVDVFTNSPKTAAQSAAFVQENVALIKTIPARYFDDIEQMVLRRFRQGVRPEELEAEIQDRYGVSQSRAALIARDQVSKLNGELTRVRQTELGISRYIWRTSKDERVRETHADQEGNIYSWSDPPATGHPGEDFQCRCHPEPVLDGLLD